MKPFACKLKEHRLAARLAQEELADRVAEKIREMRLRTETFMHPLKEGPGSGKIAGTKAFWSAVNYRR